MKDTTHKPIDAMFLYEIGTNYLKKGDWDQSVFYFNKALEIDPKFIAALFDRGLAHFRKGQYTQAIIDYTRALEIDPSNSYSYINRGPCTLW